MMQDVTAHKTSRRDFTDIARDVVETAIGEHLDGSPLEPKITTAAMSHGRLGGLKGGKSRAAKLSPAKRKRIARKSAKARWKKQS